MKMESSSVLSRKLLSYSIGAGAATLAAASAHGEIHVTDFSADPVTADTIDYNLMDPAVLPNTTGANFELKCKLGGQNASNPKAKNVNFSGSGTLLDGTYAAKLAVNDTIGSGGTFGTGDSYLHYGSNGTWKVGDRGFLGLEISVTDPTTMTTQLLYGWADISLNNLPVATTSGLTTNAEVTPCFTLYAYAYEDNGDPILAGVPEPKSTVALLIAGAAGAAALRRRRTPAQA